MTTLQRPVRQAQRRLWLNRFLTAIGWTMAVAAAAFITLVLLDRIWLATAHPGRLFGYGALGMLGAALIAAAIWSRLTREGFHVAAARLDAAAGLRERLSTGLYCERSDDPFAQAVVVDAERAASKVVVHQHLPVEVPRSAGWAGGSLIAAMLFFWLFPVVDLSGKQEVRQKEFERQQQVKRTEAVMRPILDQQLKKIGEKNPGIKKELDDLGPLKDAKLDTPADVRREAIKKVERLADKLEERKNSSDIAKVEEFQKMMRRVADQQSPSNTPVNQLAKSLAQGDFKGAQEAMKQIQSQLAKEPKTEEEKQQAEQLKAQVKQLSDKINEIAQDEKKTQDELAQKGLTQQEIKQALEQLKNKDMKALADKLKEKGLTQQQVQQMMQQLAKRAEAAEAAKKLAQNMQKGAQGKKGQQAQQGQQGQQGQKGQQAQNGQKGGQGEKGQQGQPQPGQNGEPGEGQEGFSDAAQQLSDMEMLQQQLNELQAGMNDLDALKNNLGKQGSENGDLQQKSGSGMGDLGRGAGGVPQRRATDTKNVQRRSPVNTLPGKINSQQFIDGEQFKGEVSDAYIEAAIAAKRDVTDDIAKEQIPRALQQPVAKYFTRTMSDLPANKVKSQEQEKAKAPEAAPASK